MAEDSLVKLHSDECHLTLLVLNQHCFHSNFSPSGEQAEHRKLAQES